MPGMLLCFGDLCVDVVGKANQPESAADVTLNSLSVRPAGAAVNCATAAATQGVETEMLGLVGDDPFAGLLLDRLDERVGTRYVRRLTGRTGTVISIVDSAGHTKLYSYRGVNALAYQDLPAALIESASYIYLSGYSFQDSGSRITAERLLASEVRCALDPSFQYARNFAGARLNVEFLLPNLEEARMLTGKASPEKCAAALRELGVKTAIIKLGPEGCYIHSEGIAQFLRCEPAAAVDTTGAGDAFTGTFLASLIQGKSILESAFEANLAARCLVMKTR